MPILFSAPSSAIRRIINPMGYIIRPIIDIVYILIIISKSGFDG
jgi:hypothetical protein|tara:strand:+ start:497 stop:628 length:132 start_codon:yes stop_codon:yes gene_type:complete